MIFVSRQNKANAAREAKERLTFEICFPSDVSIVENHHRDLVFPMVLLPEPLVLDVNKPLDVSLRNRYLVVVALTEPTLVGPVRDSDREAQQYNQNRVSGRASQWPRYPNNELERSLDYEGNGENEGNEVVIAEVSSAVDQTDCGGVLDGRRLSGADRWPYGR